MGLFVGLKGLLWGMRWQRALLRGSYRVWGGNEPVATPMISYGALMGARCHPNDLLRGSDGMATGFLMAPLMW